MQGLVEGRNVMVTFPIDLTVTAEARRSPLRGVEIWPPQKIKARAAVRELLRRAKFPAHGDSGLRVAIASPIPEGKGLASSSADIVAACLATASLLDIELPSWELCSIACGIEPSDAVMFDHPVAFDFLNGNVLHDPGRAVELLAVMVDAGGFIDTARFRRMSYGTAEIDRLKYAYQLAVNGLERDDLDALGQASVISARINQRRHYKPYLEDLISLARAHGGYGVSVAHSGTVAAMLFDARDQEAARTAAAEAALKVPGTAVTCVRAR